MAVVNLDALQVIFAEKTAVSAASFSVEAGETFSLIGASGCGKSTILRVLAGLQREWRGGVQLFGKAIAPGVRFQGELRRNVQMVFQDPYASLHPNHTLWRTLAEPLKIHGLDAIRQRVDTALEQVGLPAALTGATGSCGRVARIRRWRRYPGTRLAYFASVAKRANTLSKISSPFAICSALMVQGGTT